MKELQVYFEGKDEVVDFVNRVSKYACEVDLRVGRFVVDAKSILGVLGIGTGKKAKMQVFTDNIDMIKKDLAPFIVAQNREKGTEGSV